MITIQSKCNYKEKTLNILTKTQNKTKQSKKHLVANITTKRILGTTIQSKCNYKEKTLNTLTKNTEQNQAK